MSVKKIELKSLLKYLKEPWVPIVLGKVENYEIKLLEYKGQYFWHKHEKHDEFILVYEGKVTLELEDDREITLNKGDAALIEKGTAHRSKSEKASMVVVFERDTILDDFVKVTR